MKIVILDGFLANFDGIGLGVGKEHEQLWYSATDPVQLPERITDADAVITNRMHLTGGILAQCPKLKFICTLGTGYNMIDLDAAAKLGITVSNCPGYSTDAVAQATFSLLLDIVGRVSVFSHFVKDGGWRKGSSRQIVAVPTYELAGRTIGVYGMGEIGSAVGRIAAAFGMEVLGYRRNPPQDATQLGIRFVDAATLLRKADILSLHCPLSAETQGLVDKAFIAGMKDGAILLNTSRGGLLNESDVAAALNSGKLLMLGADVLTNEPPEEGNPLVHHPRTVLTPHVAWMPRETREKLLATVTANFLAFVAGKPQNVVNP